MFRVTGHHVQNKQDSIILYIIAVRFPRYYSQINILFTPMKETKCISEKDFSNSLTAFSNDLRKKILILEHENKVRSSKYIQLENKIKKLKELIVLCDKISASTEEELNTYAPYHNVINYLRESSI